jgi:hypothetical protein
MQFHDHNHGFVNFWFQRKSNSLTPADIGFLSFFVFWAAEGHREMGITCPLFLENNIANMLYRLCKIFFI